MAETVLKKRELYIDVAVKEEQLEEIFLYQVDFFRNQTFRTKEFLFVKEEPEAVENTDGTQSMEEAPEQPEPLELFREQWEILCQEEVPTEIYATDATKVMDFVFEPLMKKYAEFKAAPAVRSGREFVHDCVSMGCVISMSVFDEEQYLSAGIRRRMKERYHDYVDEIKTERKEHIFIQRTTVENMPILKILIADEKFKLKKQVSLEGNTKAETIAVRFREILSLYPEADVIVDSISPEICSLFRNMNQFMGMESKRTIFSMESMLAALGKTPEYNDIIKTYLMYIRNQEEIRLGTFLPERLYSIHSFFLPAQISNTKAWKKQFKKNTIWKKNNGDCYHITAEGEVKGKYIIKAGKEQFVLKLREIAVQRYLKKYAVIRIEVENYCYPGEDDKARINALAAGLFAGEQDGADFIELKIKDGKQAYSLTTVPMAGNENQLWLNGLLQLGRKKKKQGKKALLLSAMKEKMYCIESKEIVEEEQIVQHALIRDGVFRRIEDALAKAMRPEKGDRPSGNLTERQLKEVKGLFEIFRYIVISFGEAYEASQKKDQKEMFTITEKALGTAEVIERLHKKFGMFF